MSGFDLENLRLEDLKIGKLKDLKIERIYMDSHYFNKSNK
jgi:hypothetical protein